MMNNKANTDTQSLPDGNDNSEGRIPRLTPEQIIIWLECYRQMMFEIWANNPRLRRDWEKLNS